jgi:amino acid adenylation domain-containing protein
MQSDTDQRQAAATTDPPLSFAQERMCLGEEFSHGLPALHEPNLIWLHGPLDTAALGRALDGVVRRHEALRTRLVAGSDGQRRQQIDRPASLRLELTDHSGLDREAGQDLLHEFAAQQALRPFQLERDWPFRANLVRLTAQEHGLVLVAHRTAFDHWSLRVVLRDLAALYQEEAGGEPSALADLSVRFADYASQERDRLQGAATELADYWRGALAGLETCQLPADRPRPPVVSYDGRVESRLAAREVLDGLRELSDQQNSTLPVTLLATLHALLSRYTGQSDVVIGADFAGRVQPELVELVGPLMNTLPVRADLSEDPAFAELLRRVGAAVGAADAHQDLPFALIPAVLAAAHDVSQFPVFQIAFQYDEPPGDSEAAGVVFRPERIPLRASIYDIGFVAQPQPDGLWLEATYTPELFDAATVRRLLGNWEVLLRGAVADPSARLSQLPVLTEAELRNELEVWNDTDDVFPSLCIHQAFEEQVGTSPGAVAAQFGDQRWSYAELNQRANRIARRLRELGVGPETLVGVCMKTSLDRLACLLGVWKAGGGYVPLDPELPAERLSFMIADTGMSVVVADELSATRLPAVAGVTMLCLDREQLDALDGSDLDPAGPDGTGVAPSNVAYVIYTSGSTGEPKGVVVEHRQAINFLQGMRQPWRIGPDTAVLAFAAFTFDVSVCDMFLPLLHGGRVVLAPVETLHSPPRLAKLIRDAGITFACLPPAVLSLLVGEEFPRLRTLLSAGSELSAELFHAWLRDGLELFNGYGPTEASMGATFMRMDADTQLPPPIGRPKPNYRVYVLDQYLNPVPVGVTGELHIGGAGVARGYLNRPELTRQRFIADPFAGTPGARLYKTGDLVRRRADGTIVFAGRIDDQVKIRGLRVELGEIEAGLLAYPDVAQAVVTVIADRTGEPQLAAYLRPKPGRAPDLAGLSAHLAGMLPGYMVPGYLTVVAQFPLTTNGKIDKKALPEPQPVSAGAVRVPPATLLESALVGEYAAILGNEQVGAADRFFDMGGNSLQAMQLITRLRESLAVDLDVSAIFLAPTPQQLAALLRDKHDFDDAALSGESQTEFGETPDGQVSSVPAPPGGGDQALATRLRRGREHRGSEISRRPAGLAELPLSYGQEQLWFLDRLAPGLTAYNMPFTLRLSGSVDAAALDRAIDGLVARHEALRARLVANAEGRPVQVVDPPPTSGSGTLKQVDFSGLAPGRRQDALAELIATESLRPFSLADGPLLRVWLVRLDGEEHVLFVVVHHTVFDGWSIKAFGRELPALYAAEVTGQPADLAELPVQFADYALWERDRLTGPVLAELEGYWRKVMAGFETVQFPTDRPRPVVDSFEGGLAWHGMDRTLLDNLRELSRREGTTLFVTLMAALAALLSRYAGQTDLVIGTASANRARPELAPLLCYLVNMLPVRADVSGDPAFTQLQARTAAVMAGAFAHQDLPFGKMVETLRVERDPGRAPVFQIAMTHAERDEIPVRAGDVDFAIDEVLGVMEAKFDLALQIEARSDCLWIECSYKTALFDAATVERLLVNYEVLLRGVVADPSVRVSRLPVLADAELRRELMEWNDTAAAVPQGCVHELFEAQVARSPGAVAAEFEGRRWSYAELNERANRIARRLRELGVGPESLVGVGMLAGLDRLAGMVGIWKAGGGYVPLDPELPADRLSFMIADTGMSVVLTEERSAGQIPVADGVRVLSLDSGQERARIGALDSSDLAGTGVSSSNLAYVIYTSGSTGQPKGVVVEHRQAVNFLHGMVEHWQVTPADVVLQFSAFTFDVSVLDTFAGLLAGAKVVLAPKETLHSPPRLAGLIRDGGITFAAIPPAVLSLLVGRELPGLRVLITAGEELPSDVARSFTSAGLRFVNGYGPTEATVLATYQELDGTAYPPPIGLPVWPNYQAYVLDRYLNPVPTGVIGELHIGGAGVARGYLSRAQLTAQRFVADPFAATPGARMYKTGDLVRRRADGSIVFTGRVDDQVKIRGLRIELGEIETALCTHPEVAQAVVTVVTDPAGDRQLAGYLRPEPGTGPDPTELRAYLASRLPAYMVPAHLVLLEEFSLNASGKVDKSALPAPGSQAPDSGNDQAKPATLIEAVLADMFATLLGREQIGVTESFFDAGGSSLRVMRLLNMMQEELAVEIGVTEVFVAPTPRQLAALLRDSYGLQDAGLDEFAEVR